MAERTSINGTGSSRQADPAEGFFSRRRGSLLALLALLVFSGFILIKIDGLLERNEADLAENMHLSNALTVVLQARTGAEALRDLAESSDPLSLSVPEFVEEVNSNHKHLALVLEALADPGSDVNRTGARI